MTHHLSEQPCLTSHSQGLPKDTDTRRGGRHVSLRIDETEAEKIRSPRTPLDMYEILHAVLETVSLPGDSLPRQKGQEPSEESTRGLFCGLQAGGRRRTVVQ